MIPCSPRGSQGTGRGGPLGGQAGRGRSKQAGRGRIHKQSSQNRERPTIRCWTKKQTLPSCARYLTSTFFYSLPPFFANKHSML